jgi:hypothetical protein
MGPVAQAWSKNRKMIVIEIPPSHGHAPIDRHMKTITPILVESWQL